MNNRRGKPRFISSGELMDLIIGALDQREPFSVISVGITEAFVLAQYNIMREEDFLRDKEVWVAGEGAKRGFDHRGIRFPNVRARDMAVRAVRRADAVGYNRFLIPDALTDEVFRHYNLAPKYVFESHIRRVIMFSQEAKFRQMLAGRRLVILCSYADEVGAALQRTLGDDLGLQIIGTVKIDEFEDIPRVKEEVADLQFDLCLLAAGINAVILAPHIARQSGAVAFDLGLGMESLISGEVEYVDYLRSYISLDELMRL